jgi:hypothetical protein
MQKGSWGTGRDRTRVATRRGEGTALQSETETTSSRIKINTWEGGVRKSCESNLVPCFRALGTSYSVCEYLCLC